MSLLRQLTRTQWIGLVLVISILFVDMLLYSLFIPVVPYFTEQYQMSSTTLGILFGSYAAALFLTTPMFGRITDRLGRRKTIILGLICMIAATLLFVFSQTTMTLILARFIQGLAAAASWTAALALLADLFPGPMRGAVMGIAMTGISSGSLLGAPIGGWLFEVGDHHTPFWFAMGLTLLITSLVVLLLREPKRMERPAEGGAFSLLRHRTVLFIACVILLAETTLTMLEPLLPVYVTERFQLSPLTLGLLFGAMTLCYGLIAPISGSLAVRYNPFRLMLFGLAGLAVTLPLIVMASSVPLMMLAGCFIGAAVGFTLSPTLPTLGSIVDKDAAGGDYGAAYALFNMIHAVGMMLGPVASGVLTDTLTVTTSLVVVSTVILAVAISFSILMRRHPKTYSLGMQAKAEMHV
ncbi:MFS transporter [Paenibacillus apiarius]|uniref:MFS transporter n=1 Tax=Paenibacillus apiarius TaxID=46240 RepID=A0ABT4DS47_9BACL|nr:MFS transporter [Paenibacillus apiarius]MCY9515442.1 MFS transporter [Paenibacillus apiarius]MCY9518851.1 MFS transporter [Paenibacillus apiarius]MCY9552102.1 MFS transporter [Paenibacillus apiarius]MCY9557222.1 MFS transporter [Paenibacillus apiarius]MCY9682600.1 MFS transporter [Paenibacillus apiarius]